MIDKSLQHQLLKQQLLLHKPTNELRLSPEQATPQWRMHAWRRVLVGGDGDRHEQVKPLENEVFLEEIEFEKRKEKTCKKE